MDILVSFSGFGWRKTKPNKANLPAFGRKSEILSPKSETDRMEAKRQIPAHFKDCDLKKQACPERSRMEPIYFVLSAA